LVKCEIKQSPIPCFAAYFISPEDFNQHSFTNDLKSEYPNMDAFENTRKLLFVNHNCLFMVSVLTQCVISKRNPEKV